MVSKQEITLTIFFWLKGQCRRDFIHTVFFMNRPIAWATVQRVKIFSGSQKKSAKTWLPGVLYPSKLISLGSITLASQSLWVLIPEGNWLTRVWYPSETIQWVHFFKLNIRITWQNPNQIQKYFNPVGQWPR